MQRLIAFNWHIVLGIKIGDFVLVCAASGAFPSFHDSGKRLTGLALRRVSLRHPLQLVANQHWCLQVHGLHQGDQIRVGQYHAAITGLRHPGKLVGWRTMQPDTATSTACGTVPVIRVVNRQCTLAIEVWQLGTWNLTADKINALGCLLIALFQLIQTEFANRYVITVNYAQIACLIEQQIQTRLAGINGNGMAYRSAKHQKIIGNRACCWHVIGEMHAPLQLLLQALQMALQVPISRYQPWNDVAWH